MKVRCSHASVNGNDEITEFSSGGIEIISDDGKRLFQIRVEDNVLMVAAGDYCKHNGKILDDSFIIKPRAANCIDIVKPEYKKS